MQKITHLEIYKRLNKSNCRDCGIPTCMAFALSVIHGDKSIEDCPHFDKKAARELDGQIFRRAREKGYEAAIEPLKHAVSGVDFSAVADGLGAELVNDRLRINCLGKDFFIDNKGNLESVCHIHTWIMMPLLKYIKIAGNAGFSGRWISFEELKKGATMARYFNRRCEKPLLQLAESHTDIFFDLLNIFGSKNAEGFSADYARVIYPLPKVPFLILFWKPEDHFESNLKLLFDSTADTYLDTHSIYALGRGIVEMFKKILSRHDELLPALMAL
ncbi:MAG: DUF3786 domain-containing protein [Nitrospirae bacterium]|nr:DUF3786 domain-containing protein [Nitrospirota bacterium]